MTTAQALPRAATRGKWTRFRSSLFQDYWALAAVAFLALVVLAAIAAPLLVSGDVNKPDYGVRLKPPLTAGHPLGTDQLGRDVFDRLILGSRISVTVGFASVVIAGVIGTLIGVIAAYYGGWIDSVLMRLADVQLSFPFILLALVINAIIGLGLRNIIITLVIAGWVEYARIARGEILALREREFVEAARVVGAGNGRIMLRHLLPNIVTPIIVISTLQVARFIVAEASISFLGFGVQPPTPAWGSMISEGMEYIFAAWWLVTIPGLALALVALAVNIAGDWLRDVLDPRLKV
ncbi:ABC transporter permease [Sphaerobacter thermophilus]|uniref:Binding-protein-dependent transport systems inner membrane component n=1 Tax=Sphaerobacter thermophilus (strain ATCC 49802 / DSM 20745 / KCCM 41009 / NCIMB 13125 / S 6022) TaxID=479434 RepID=D1C5I0_SPHTD|nr:ABC transporter permease [Sphaerobacter thermophilus]ACZ37496.1 binding-protein-dependent transport systems inner membrane component [Sphaerobacter thermophilus DSM 20745]